MNESLTVTPIKTRIYRQGESLMDFIFNEVPSKYWQEGSILVISSKIVSLAENRIVEKQQISKKDLIQREATAFLGEISYHKMSLTLHHNLLMPAAGIDESNSENGQYILLPESPFKSAEEILSSIKLKFKLEKFGILLVDSKSNPLRHGTVGISLAYAGFLPVDNRVGAPDLFGKILKITKVNIPDSLAATAVLVMGESNESTPLCFLSNPPVNFVDTVADPRDLYTSIEDDLYGELYSHRIPPKPKE